MAVTNNLYPPIVQDVQPAFVRTQDCKIYFSLSLFNSLSEIKHVQVSLVNQTTNQTAFNPTKWPLGIKFISSISEVIDPVDDYKYYITINTTDLINNEFALNQFYKVQIRFGDNDLPNNLPSFSNISAGWINYNINNFSEWSKVCLIKGIEQPAIDINELKENPLPVSTSRFTGRLYYEQNINEKETLKSYNLQIQNLSKQKTLIKTEEIYTNQYNPNEFYYQLPYDLQIQTNYKLTFNLTTNNLYKETHYFYFRTSQEINDKLSVELIATPEESNGSIKIEMNFNSNPFAQTSKDLIIKRTSAKTNFLQWESLKTIPHDADIKHLWYDTTIESGVWYKYRIQQVGKNAKISKISQPVMCLFEDIFLTRGSKQLKIQFNPAVSDFKYNIPESQQVTLGAQYPYIKRNGNNYYRTFSLSGLISALMDEIRWYDPGLQNAQFYDKNSIQPFATANELFGDAAAALHNKYNQINDISYYQDYIYERAFRQKVMQFLYENNIKLFRSLTEGNILVKLTNIAFQPIDALGRRLYSFSATVVEIDKIILENLNKYNLINKIYYTYAKKTLQNIFKSEESLINKFYSEWPEESKENTDIMQLDISHDISQDIVVYAKPINNNNLLRYIAPKSGTLSIFYSDADPIAESYFYGIHFNEDELKYQEGHYENPQDIKNPVNYGVYSIVEHYFIRIDRYIQYFREADLLSTYYDEVLQNSVDNYDYDLLAESMEPVYFNMIYYNQKWYPLLDNNDIIIKNFPATITFTYRTKKED